MGLHLLILLLSPVLLHMYIYFTCFSDFGTVIHMSFNILYTCSHSLMSSHTQSWEGEEKQELKEVVSEPTTPPLSTDDDKPNPVSLAPLLAVVESFPHHME